MTIAELIEELSRFPPHHPVLIDVGLRYDESVHALFMRSTGDMDRGPYVSIATNSDPRNYPSDEAAYYG